MMPILEKLVYGSMRFPNFFLRINTGKQVGFSFNLADRCPVGCDCYWRANPRVRELSDDEVIRFFEARREEGLTLATIVGGEPYVRRDLLPKVTPIMPANWVVTSATTPLLHLPKTTHFISIDGKDAETHDRVRKMLGLYRRIVKNLERARNEGRFPAFIHSVLNRLNHRQAREILQTWQENGLVDGVAFSFITNINGGGDAALLLDREQRRRLVDELLGLKREFGTFLAMSPAMIRRMHPDLTEKQTPETCGTAIHVGSYDASGEKIKQCIFSEKGDCAQCGCIITSLVDTINNPRTIRVAARVYSP